MNRDEIIISLQQFKLQKKAEYHIDKIGIFGSVARNKMTDESDIDIVSYRKKMNKFLKRRIDSEALYV